MVIIDAAIEPAYKSRVVEEASEALCLGISLLTGPMISGAIETARAVKECFPQLPIISGGWHPSLLPDEMLNEPFVDAVVRGQGEATLLEVVERLAEKQSIEGIRGLSSKLDGCKQHNSERRVQRRSRCQLQHTRWLILTLTSVLAAFESWRMPPVWVSLRLQLLHRYGVLQTPIQCPFRRPGSRRAW